MLKYQSYRVDNENIKSIQLKLKAITPNVILIVWHLASSKAAPSNYTVRQPLGSYSCGATVFQRFAYISVQRLFHAFSRHIEKARGRGEKLTNLFIKHEKCKHLKRLKSNVCK